MEMQYCFTNLTGGPLAIFASPWHCFVDTLILILYRTSYTNAITTEIEDTLLFLYLFEDCVHICSFGKR